MEKLESARAGYALHHIFRECSQYNRQNKDEHQTKPDRGYAATENAGMFNAALSLSEFTTVIIPFKGFVNSLN